MRFRTGLVGFSVLALLLLPTTATAGGWWSSIDLRGPYLGSGESLTVRSSVMFETPKMARRARTVDYRAYLVRGLDTLAMRRITAQAQLRRWWTPPTVMTLVGNVELSSNLGIATAHLSIPEMPPGAYHLVFCDFGCRILLGDLFPLEVEVSDDPVVAQTARRLEKTYANLKLSLTRVRHALRRVETETRARAAAAHESTEAAVAESNGAIARSEKRISALEAGGLSDPWMAYSGWFLGGATIALVAMRFWRRRAPALSPSAPEVSVEPMPDDARELISSP